MGRKAYPHWDGEGWRRHDGKNLNNSPDAGRHLQQPRKRSHVPDIAFILHTPRNTANQFSSSPSN